MADSFSRVKLAAVEGVAMRTYSGILMHEPITVKKPGDD
jgi:hypothetical protein